MAFSKVLSGGLADDAVSGENIAPSAYLENTATQNISGTYSGSRLYTSDAYTLSGNTTVNSNITLSSVTQTDVTLTASGAYTITGEGTLSGGSLTANAGKDLTGMTGTLGSDVSTTKGFTLNTAEGSPYLNLGNAKLREGSILKNHFWSNQDQTQIGNNQNGAEVIRQRIIAVADYSAFYLSMTVHYSVNAATNSSDKGDWGVTCWLQNAAGFKYRFGYQKTSGNRHTGMLGQNNNFGLGDADGGQTPAAAWNSTQLGWSWVSGNQASSNDATLKNSQFRAGEELHFVMWMAAWSGPMAVNRAHYDSANSCSMSVFNIHEVAGDSPGPAA